MAKVKRLIYALFEVKSIDKWRDHMATMYGLTLKPAARQGEYEAVIDETGCRLLFRQGPANDCISTGYEADNLEGLKTHLDGLGEMAVWGSQSDAESRGATKLLKTIDPIGVEVEIVDQAASYNAFEPADYGHVFDCGDLGLGHITFNHEKKEQFEQFYTTALGFGVSDYNEPAVIFGIKVKVVFLHVFRRHHSVACAKLDIGRRLNHFQLEVLDRNHVGLGFSRCLKAGIPIAHRVGVHPNDNQISFYVRTPSGFQSELGAESDTVADDHETVTLYGFSIWGHSMPFMQTVIAAKNILRSAIKTKLRRLFRGTSAV